MSGPNNSQMPDDFSVPTPDSCGGRRQQQQQQQQQRVRGFRNNAAALIDISVEESLCAHSVVEPR